MSIYTQLSPTATPGKRYSFSPKSAAGSGPHTGTFTALSVLGTPGQIHSFVAKGVTPAGPHTGLFTALSVMAVPGGMHVFTAKGSGLVVVPDRKFYESSSQWFEVWQESDHDLEEKELMEIIQILCVSGVLDE